MNLDTKDKLNNQLAAARSMIAKTGKSPRQLGKESRQKVINWIYQWGYTTTNICKLLLNRTSGGYMGKLTYQKWLCETNTKSGFPSSYFTLAPLGLEEAERHANSLLKYLEIDQYKVNQQKIRHDLIAQKSTLQALNSNVIVGYETEKMNFKDGDKSGKKRPDVTWITNSGLRLGIEIELSAKWDRDLDQFVLAIARALKSDGNDKPSYNRFVIISDSPAIIKRYRAAIQPDAPLSIWTKSSRGHWEIINSIKVPTWLIHKVDFQLLEG